MGEYFILVASQVGTLFLLMAVGYVLHFASARVEAGTMRLVQRMPIVLYAVMMTALIWLIMQMRNGDVQPFIYFQF